MAKGARRKKNPLNSTSAQLIFDKLCAADDPVNYAIGIVHLAKRNEPIFVSRWNIWGRIKNFFLFRSVNKFEENFKTAKQHYIITAIGIAVDYRVHDITDSFYDIISKHTDPLGAALAMRFLISRNMLDKYFLNELTVIKESKDPLSAAKILISLNARDCLPQKQFNELAKKANDLQAQRIEYALMMFNNNYDLQKMSESGLLLSILEKISTDFEASDLTALSEFITTHFAKDLSRYNLPNQEYISVRITSELDANDRLPVPDTKSAKVTSRRRVSLNMFSKSQQCATEPQGNIKTNVVTPGIRRTD